MAALAVSPANRRSLVVLAWAAAPVLALAIVVQVRGVGLDLLMVAVIGLVLLALERTLGSLLSDRIGPFAAGVIFAALVVGLSWFFLSNESGRGRTERFFADAERRGYRAVFFKNPRAEASARVPGADPARQPAATSGDVAPAAARTTGPAVRPASAASGDPGPQPAADSGSSPQAAAARSPSRFSRTLRSFFSRSTEAKTPTSISPSVSPSSVALTQRVVLSAHVRAGDVPVTQGTVEFQVNGRGAGRVFVDAKGFASTTFTPALAGSYELRVRYAGSAEFDSSVATTSFAVR